MARTPGVVKPERINLGSGYLQIGPSNTLFANADFQDVGALAGAGQITFQDEKKTYMGGNPEVMVLSRRTKRGIRLEVDLMEVAAETFRYMLGLPDTSLGMQAAGSQTVTGETKTLVGENWHHLTGVDVSSMTVTTTEATPTVLIAGTDYEYNTKFGMLRRIGGGAIADGATVSVSYTWQRPKTMTLGSDASSQIDWFPIRFVVPVRYNRRKVFEMYKGEPGNLSGGISFGPEFHQIKLTFDGLVDESRDPGADLWKLYNEEI